MILSSYVLIWFAYGNLYYFSCDVDNYDRILKADKTLKFDKLQEESIKVQFQTPIKGIGNFWQWDENLGLKSVNRIEGFLDCLYFSGVTMLTVGYGDITPVSRLLRFFSILQGFLGQIIVVVAMGIWVNQITARNKSA
ncbi:two pore domain potassium channel family protein [Campylobacter sp. US33a]|nr:two pore domain potassium channel family protein [Campylobacter sp. US33a]